MQRLPGIPPRSCPRNRPSEPITDATALVREGRVREVPRRTRPVDCPEDIDGDGMAGFADVLILLGNWTV